MQGNALSPILCNIYLDKLDTFVKDEIIAKMVKGIRPLVNPNYQKKTKLTLDEEKLPEHVKNKILKSRRRHVQKLGIKRILENEEFIRIKYIRYGDEFIIGVRGSIDLARKIKERVKDFLKSTLHLELNEEKTKITNTYADRANFLGMYIYNMNPCDIPYLNSREVENTKRVLRRKADRKGNARDKILKNTRDRIIKALENSHKKILVTDAFIDIGGKGKERSKIRVLAKAIEDVRELDNSVEPINNEMFTKVKGEKKHIQKQIPINRIEILRRIHLALTKYNASSTDITKRG